MRVLVIGGSRFVGAAIVDELCARGHQLTLFNRGTTNASLFAKLDCVRGERASELERLGAREFDAIVDTCGYTPDAVSSSAMLAVEQRAFYVFVSSASVYAAAVGAGEQARVNEDQALAEIDPAHAVAAPENYGAAKVLCERMLTEALPQQVAIVRAGLVVGPRDYTDRFPYWAHRLAEPGPILCPGDGNDAVQMIDARDLASFITELAESRSGGTFNASGPSESATFAEFVRQVAPSSADLALVWAPSPLLAAEGVRPWQDMPLWLPKDHEHAGILRLDISRAQAAGLSTRSWAKTATDTREWMRASGRRPPFRAGLTAEREAALIARAQAETD